MKAVHTINSLRSDHGGPSRSVTALCRSLDAHGVEVEVVTHAPGEGEGVPVMPGGEVTVRFAPREPGLRAFLPGATAFSTEVARSLEDESVVHDHGLWLPSNHAVARAASRAGVPRIVSIRGMLSTWAMQAGAVKKRAAWIAYQRRDLARAAVLHATSDAEVESVRALGLRTPVALVPNGVDVPAARTGSDGNASEGNRTRRVLFLGRLHPVKGVATLVQAWGRVRPVGWELVLAGPDDGGHRGELEQAVRDLGLESEVRFPGPVDDDEKWDLYRSADLFVLPTFSENFGIVVAEALAAGVPVITTTGAPWQDLETHDCGWWIEIGVEPLVAALGEALALDDEPRRAMGARGLALVERAYSWDRAAEQMAAVYRWALGTGSMPDTLVM